MLKVPSLSLVVLLTVATPQPLLAAEVNNWVGNQSDGQQLGQAASFFDGNQWLKLRVPQGADTALFSDDFFTPPNISREIHFGDFKQDLPLDYNPVVISGNDATVYSLGVESGPFTFSLDGHSLSADNIFVGTSGDVATMTIRGGGTINVESMSAAGQFDAQSYFGTYGTIDVRDPDTIVNVAHGVQIGAAGQSGVVIVRDGAEFNATSPDLSPAALSIGHAVISGEDSSGLFDVRDGGTATLSGFVYVRDTGILHVGANGTVQGDYFAFARGQVVAEGSNALLDVPFLNTDAGSSLLVRTGAVSSSNTLNVGGSVLVTEGGRIVVDDTLDVIATGTATVQQLNHSIGTVVVDSNGDTNTGDVHVGSHLAVDGLLNANVNVLSGLFSGVGVINGNVTNGAIVSPGSPPGFMTISPGIMTVNGDYTQIAHSLLRLEIGGTAPGTGYDVLNVTGTMTLHGAVTITFINNFVPGLHDHFDLMSFGSYSAPDVTLSFVGAPAGFRYSTSTAGGHFGLDVLAVPEPSTFVLMSTALLAIAQYRRRRTRTAPRPARAF